MNIHWNILDEERKNILPLLNNFKEDGFYLAGGTGLALLIGHRDSIDFDFFKEGDYDTAILKNKIEEIFNGHNIVFTQEEKNTISCVIDGKIQLSFFGYRHSLLESLIETEYFNIASVSDIGCMKLSAITSRSVEKDYVDLYFILKNISLSDLLLSASKKYPSLDASLLLKSLVYFDDVLSENILFKEGHDVSFDEIKKNLKEIVENYFKNK